MFGIMATQTLSVEANANTAAKGTSQVRVQLSTRHPDVSLPENPGPILVNTSTVAVDLSQYIPPNAPGRFTPLCSLYACQHPLAVGETHTFRVPYQWYISSNVFRRIPYSEWHIL